MNRRMAAVFGVFFAVGLAVVLARPGSHRVRRRRMLASYDLRCKGGCTATALVEVQPSLPTTSQIANPGATLRSQSGAQWTWNRPSPKFCRKTANWDTAQLCPYPEDFTNWATAGVNATAPTVTGNVVTAPDGTLSAEQIVFPSVSAGAFNASTVNLQFTLSSGVYTASIYLRASSGTPTVYFNLGNGSTYSTVAATLTTSWQRFTITTGTISGTYFLGLGCDTRDAAQPSLSASTVYAWGAKLEAGASATAYVSPMLVSLGNNVPCFESKGLFEEPGNATNLALQSQTFDNAYWTKIASATIPVVTADQMLAPDGTLTADKVVYSAQPISNFSLIRSSAITATAAAYTASVYIYSASAQTIYVSANSGVNYTACSLGANTWTFCSDTRTLSASTFTMDIGWNVAGVTPPATTVYLWGAMFTAHGLPQSYVATTGSTATRSAESGSVTIPGGMGKTSGCIKATITPTWTGAGSDGSYFVATPSQSSVYQPGANSPLSAQEGYGGAIQAPTGAFVANTAKSYLLQWNSAANVASIQEVGQSAATTTFSGMTTASNTLQIGQSGGDPYWIYAIKLGSAYGTCL